MSLLRGVFTFCSISELHPMLATSPDTGVMLTQESRGGLAPGAVGGECVASTQPGGVLQTLPGPLQAVLSLMALAVPWGSPNLFLTRFNLHFEGSLSY